MNSHVEIIQNSERFYSLESCWERLLNSSDQKDLGYFNSWYWASTWWKVYANSNDELFIVCLWDEGNLVGVAPFYIKNQYAGIVKSLFFIGTGEPEEVEVATEYLDLLVMEEWGEYFVSIVAKEVHSIIALVHIEFLNVLDDNLYLFLLVAKLKKKFFLRKRACGYRYIAKINDGEEASLSERQLKKYQVSNRRFIKSGGASCWRIIDDQSLSIGMEVLSDLHQLRWKSKGKSGVFSSAEFVEFHGLISKALLSNNNLLMFILSVKDRPIAIFYGWKFKDTLSYYQSGIDAAIRPNMSPGILMHVEAMRWAKSKELSYYDFMKGGSASYKSDFAEKGQSMCNLVFFKKTFRSYLYHTGEYLIQRLRGSR